MAKKEAAFALFEEGKTAISPEVKALKLKSHTRATYFWEWKRGKGVTGSQSRGGETVGGIDETRQIKKDENQQEVEEAETPKTEAILGEELEFEEPETEKPQAQESIGGASEAREKEGKDKDKPSAKAGLTIAEEGIRCVVFLSLPTLTLYEIAAAKQVQLSGNGVAKLTLGDFLDTCAETFFKDRNLKLGLIKLGGKQ